MVGHDSRCCCERVPTATVVHVCRAIAEQLLRHGHTVAEAWLLLHTAELLHLSQLVKLPWQL